LLLFTIGVEFSIRRLREMKNLVLIGGGLQVGLTIAATALVSTLLGRDLNQAIYFGFLLALSSTAIVLKTYVDRREIDAPHGRAGVGILLFQDVSIVFMILLVPLLAGGGTGSTKEIVLSLGGSFLALALIVVLAWFLIPKILEQVVKLNSPEVLLMTAALISFGTAWITQQFGLSLAIGAFIAGVVLSESEYSHQVTADILPFRDVFNSIFFVSIGLLLSLPSLIENLTTVLFWVVLLIVGKALITLLVIRLLGFPLRVAAMTGLGLAQIGEFSFVLAKAGRGTDLLPATDYQVFLAASIISMFATPFLIGIAPRFGYFVQSLIGPRESTEAEDTAESIHVTSSGGLNNHVIIVGYGINGQHLARVLKNALVPYTILEINSEKVRRARAKGEKINFGDATRRQLLKNAGVENSNALVLAISDPVATRRAVSQARLLNKDLYILVRTQHISEITELVKLGASEVIPVEFETSIEIFSRVLQRYGVARPVIESQTDVIRRQSYEVLRARAMPEDTRISNLNTALHTATTGNCQINKGAAAIQKTFAGLNLRSRSGATVIAVIRDGQTEVNPGADFEIREQDILVLLGDSEHIDRAIKILKGDKERSENAAD
ncbi:MAG: cation:proton antiporter, partial [Acidobacteriota bacterium]|nr:cation:proton antiporter [Acidobacteriota bacterium]